MQENNIDLLNLSQPWDCQRFPKSKTICYGGGGGGGSVGNLGKVVEPSLKGLDLTKSTGYLSPKGVKKITSTLKAAGDGSAYTNAVNEMNKKIDAELKSSKKGGGLFGSGISISTPKITTPKITTPKITTPKITTPKVTVPSVVDIKKGVSDTIENIKSGASSTIESVKSDIAKSDIGRGISSTVESVKSDIARSDLGSGAIEEAIKRSDIGIVTEQAKDVLNAPGIYVGKKLEEFKKYAKDRLGLGGGGGDDSGSSGASTGSGPGTGVTMGSGGTSGLRAGAQMKSGRQRAKQNKRALRISRRS